MFFFMYIFIFFFGATLASFLNLCVYRIEKKDSIGGILKGRSFCENCRKVLRWHELTPVFSSLFLKGKCSSCKKSIGFFNLFSELFLGTTFLFFYILNLPVTFFVFLIVLYFFATYDFNYKGIPKNIADLVFLFSLLYFLIILLLDFDITRVYSIALFLFLVIVLRIASMKKMLFGFGDVIVFAMLALWFTFDLFISIFFFSFLIGGVFSILLVLKDRRYMKKYIPFLPFVLFGFVVAALLYSVGIEPFDYIYTMW